MIKPDFVHLDENLLKQTPEFITGMSQKNAEFIYKNKTITSDKAIALITKNNKLNVNAYNSSKNKQLVYLSKSPILIANNIHVMK